MTSVMWWIARAPAWTPMTAHVPQGQHLDLMDRHVLMRMNVSRTTEAAVNFVLTWRTPSAVSVGLGARWEAMGKPVKKLKAVTITTEAAAIPVLKWKTHTSVNARGDLFCQKTTTPAKFQCSASPALLRWASQRIWLEAWTFLSSTLPAKEYPTALMSTSISPWSPVALL